MQYKDEKGNVLYGFSQESLSKTNSAISKTNKYLQLLIVLMVLFLGVFIGFLVWLEYNDVFTRLIYGG